VDQERLMFDLIFILIGVASFGVFAAFAALLRRV
jgi:hypothetical protein